MMFYPSVHRTPFTPARRFSCVLVAIVALVGALSLHAAEIPLPLDSGIANVRDYGAKGDGITDDTEAIRRAISENIDKNRYRAAPMIYFPKGTYLVSGPIESRIQTPKVPLNQEWSAGWRAMMVLLGESREGTIIRLKDNAPGYNDPAKPRWLIATGSEGDRRDNQAGGGNRAFRHGILNLTVDVGRGNPGAIAIDFVASNRGAINDVLVRAAPGSGHTGVGLTRWWPGPAIVMNVRIDGFARGIAVDHYQYGMTFENIQMINQREVGITNTHNVLAMRNVHFIGTVPFYQGRSGHNMLSLLDSKIVGTGTGNLAAITTAGILNLARVSVSGYGMVVDDTSRANQDLPAEPQGATFVARHDQGVVISASGAKPEWLDLPIEEIPAVPYPAKASDWTDGGTTAESLQAAIDSGAEYIFIRPLNAIELRSPIILRGRTRLVMGLNGHLKAPPGVRAVRVEDGEAPVVVFHHMYLDGGVEHVSNRTFALIHGDLGSDGVLATGSGKTHIVDVIGRGYDIGPRHSFWARQLNSEFGTPPLFTNSGTSWILGFKMETSPTGSPDAPLSTPSLLNRAGRTEIIGGLLYTLGNGPGAAPRVPAFTTTSGRIAVSYRTNGRPDTRYPIIHRQGTLESGQDFPSSRVQGEGAALLTN